MRSRSELPGRGERARVARRVFAVLEPERPGTSDETAALRPDSADLRRRPPRRSISTRIRDAMLAAAQRRGWRFDPGLRGAAAMGVAALAAVLIAGWWVLSARPHAAAVTVPSSSAHSTVAQSSSAATTGQTARPTSVPASTTSSGAQLVIDVVGRVQSPGIYHLPAGSRVDDAIKAAGGAVPGTDLSALNLARKLSDGEQIAVGVAGAPEPAGSGAGTAAGPVDLNSATVAQLDALPGVGPVLAQHIIDWRTAHGRFDSVDQLREVSGIGAAKYADLRPLVTV